MGEFSEMSVRQPDPPEPKQKSGKLNQNMIICKINLQKILLVIGFSLSSIMIKING
jgi:hypothetical protein